ncbi:MFS transporter [Leucobacter sp. G161]|uniref:MFS transporter n=1 Tax=Leucobacter sp. G161 TaxID=663704 RepID=UPI000A979C22|nr:MFS transporter [Leucobacter sp. G161]
MTSSSPDTNSIPISVPAAIPSPDRLMSREHLATVAVLAGGTVLYAMNLYFTAALLPSIVADIGGAHLFAWVATGFLVAAVVSSMLVARVIAGLGARGAYLLGFGTFAVGPFAAALSSGMELFVASRVLQGLGGGLLAGLGFAVIRSALPRSLWLKASALVSAMWGIGALVGPSLGGIFAELQAWRWAYGALAAIALLLGAATLSALPRRAAHRTAVEPLPYVSLLALVLAAASFSLAPVLAPAGHDATAIIVGILLVMLFLLAEAKGRNTVLPRMTFERGNPLKWVYLLLAGLCAGVMVETYVPLFGQELGGLSPVWAGFLGAALSLGWTGSQLVSVKFGPRMSKAVMVISPLVLAAGLLSYGLLQQPGASLERVALWAVALILAGTAIGAAFPHLSVRAMGATDDQAEGEKAAAALSTTQLIAYALVSALLGVFASGAGGEPLMMAERISTGLAVITGAAVVPGVMLLLSARRKRRARA